VKVIRHEAVRKDFKLRAGGSAQKLRQDQSYGRAIHEVMTTLVGANREEILAKATVFDAIKAAQAAHCSGSRRKIRAGQAGSSEPARHVVDVACRGRSPGPPSVSQRRG
jgi:hypothetical protein